MFELNPLANPDASWQHILILAVALILGYIIGYISRKNVISDMETELSRIDSDLKYCKDQKIILKNSVTDRVQVNNVREVVPVMPVVEKIQHDDLKIIEGIGPKIESILNNAGIYSFRQLSQKNAEQISEILTNYDSRFQIHDTTTWPRQAELAANGDWDRLKAWQDELNGGSIE